MLPEHLLCGRLEVGAEDEQLMVPALSELAIWGGRDTRLQGSEICSVRWGQGFSIGFTGCGGRLCQK